MFRKILVSALALSVAAGAVSLAEAQQADNDAPAAAQPAPNAPKGIFGRLDADGDGSISQDEFGGTRMDMLQAADENQDGTLSQEELTNYVMLREFQRRAERLANRLDIDGDGTVTVAEIEDHQGKRFALLDRNSDGMLSQDELRRGEFGKRAMHMRGMDRDGPRFSMRHGEGHHRKFMHHRMEPAGPAGQEPSQQ
ncbi:EF-hand domain-containing protein [Chelativorans sp. AA-79]|uniref:EF-hand domain-containing protein n=1 Tax=Chelativorans sp. AA-79 TaxID=3028735 RepID=UPI0023FA4402|nr:EF-hand domain-containing protein [Chelativorans sp. AA-79]WEX11420.1 EF-hand domain-containing protein [Chelativorans sp. AA-79]